MEIIQGKDQGKQRADQAEKGSPYSWASNAPLKERIGQIDGQRRSEDAFQYQK